MSNHRKINSKPFQEAVYWVYVYVGLLSYMIGTIHFIRDMPKQVGGGGWGDCFPCIWVGLV